MTSSNDVEEDDDEVGGLFKVISEKKKRILEEKDVMNAEDCSLFSVQHIRNWHSQEVSVSNFENYFHKLFGFIYYVNHFRFVRLNHCSYTNFVSSVM